MLDILMILVLAQWGSHSIYLIPLLLDKLFNLPNAWYIVSVLCIRSCYDHLLMEDTLLALVMFLLIVLSIPLRGNILEKQM